MLSGTNNYIAGMHTFDYERFQRTFLQNHFSEKTVPNSTWELHKECIFQDRRGRKITQTYGNGDNVWRFLHSRKNFLEPFYQWEWYISVKNTNV